MTEAQLLDVLAQTAKQDNDLTWLLVAPDVFVIPNEADWLLYAPFKNRLLQLNNSALFEFLTKPDLLSSHLENSSSEKHHEHKHCGVGFPPIGLSLALSPTTGCQLACKYCYARAGQSTTQMPPAFAKDAIRFSANVCKSFGTSVLRIEFHGEGEPTFNWRLIERAVTFANEICSENGITAKFSIVTNGILSPHKIDFLVTNQFSIGVSIDGIDRYHDLQRPLKRNKSSFDRVIDSIRQLDSHNQPYTLRFTASAANVGHMPAFIRYVAQETKCKHVEFEPIADVGRATDTGIEAPKPLDFVKNFTEAENIGRTGGIFVGSSMLMSDIVKRSFCGAYGDYLNFVLSAGGTISSCYEVLDPTDNRISIFGYGILEDGEPKLDTERIRNLREFDFHSFPQCGDCFAKAHCAGGCIARNFDSDAKPAVDTDRCYITRFFSIRYIRQIAKSTSLPVTTTNEGASDES